jgi:hypothetical protein
MQTVALVVATVTALVFTAVGVRALFLQARIGRLIEQAGGTLDSDVRQALAAWVEAARGLQQAVGKLEQGMTALNRSLDRVDRITKTLEGDLHALSVVQPVISRIGSWLGGVRKGLSKVGGGRAGVRRAAEGVDTEAG